MPREPKTPSGKARAIRFQWQIEIVSDFSPTHWKVHHPRDGDDGTKSVAVTRISVRRLGAQIILVLGYSMHFIGHTRVTLADYFSIETMCCKLRVFN
jgi:glutathione S-transferase